jgi:hypothetical protein
MKEKEIKLPLTPITDETFKRQKWYKHRVGDVMMVDDEDDEYTSNSSDEEAEIYYYTLPLPRSRGDEYAPRLTSNSTDEVGILKDMGLAPGTFFVELMGTDGLGYCDSEEELEVLYKVLTGENLE